MIDLQRLLEAIGRAGLVPEDASGVVDQNVYAGVAALKARGECPHLRELSEVRKEGVGLELACQSFGLLLRAPHKSHRVAVRDDLAGGRCADSVAGPVRMMVFPGICCLLD